AFLPGHWRYLDGLAGGLSARQRGQLTTLLNRLAQSVQDAEARTAAAADGEAPLVAAGAGPA
ncbi:MAG: hypothetical protein QOF00_5292, partial [Pseudonocardiales bacterium]|nr:hypothetical protein [Pseudonocardiales bacterium]